MKQEIVSVFTVISYKTGKQIEEAINGSGQEAIKWLRTQYPRHTKFVLEGFEIDGLYSPLLIKNNRH